MGSVMQDGNHAEGMVLSSHKEELPLAYFNAYLMVFHLLLLGSRGLHLLRSGRVFVSLVFQRLIHSLIQ